MKVAVTGCASDFGTVIVPLLLADPGIEEVVGIDLREPRLAHERLRFEQEDVRSARLGDLLAGCEAVVHLAFVVLEIHDKELTHDINLNGSRNVIEACAANGVRRLVMASSIAAYGVHPDTPPLQAEEAFPRGNHDSYYAYDKAEVEHFVEWWERRNPDSGLSIARLRPPFVAGPAFDNYALDLFAAPQALVPREPIRFQLLHEDDLAAAFAAALQDDHEGPFNLGTDDTVSLDDLAAIHGQRLLHIPLRAARALVEGAFRLHLLPASADWIVAGETSVSNQRAKRELSWAPRLASRETAHVLMLQHGRPLMPGRGAAALMRRKEVAEAALAGVTATLREWAGGAVPGLAAALEGPEQIDRMAARVEHDYIDQRGTGCHIEVHAADQGQGTIVFTPGLGAHARFYLPAMGTLCDRGFNVVAADRPGHGLSEGRRGDCSLEAALDLVEAAARYARDRFGGPVVLAGSSMGGIITWLALTREPDIEAAICHNIAHPGVLSDPSMRWKGPLLRRLGQLAPHAPVPIRQIADFEAISVSPAVVEHLRERRDGLWCERISASFGAQLLSYQPPLDWSEVRTPTLVLEGAADEMVTAAFTRACFERSHPATAELRELSGQGHLLFHDHLTETVDQVVEFARAASASPAAA